MENSEKACFCRTFRASSILSFGFKEFCLKTDFTVDPRIGFQGQFNVLHVLSRPFFLGKILNSTRFQMFFEKPTQLGISLKFHVRFLQNQCSSEELCAWSGGLSFNVDEPGMLLGESYGAS